MPHVIPTSAIQVASRKTIVSTSRGRIFLLTGSLEVITIHTFY